MKIFLRDVGSIIVGVVIADLTTPIIRDFIQERWASNNERNNKN